MESNNENRYLKDLRARLAVGRMAYDAGSFSQAARHFQLALNAIEEHNLPDFMRAKALLGMAKSTAAIGDFGRAKVLLEKALLIDEADHQSLVDEAEDYHQLSLLYWRSGDIAQAMTIAKKAWELAVNEPDCPHVLTAKLLKHFAVLSEQSGNLAECEEYLNEAIDFIEDSSQLGKQSSIYGDVLLVKVLLLVEQNRLQEAFDLYPHAIQIVEFNRGPAHPRVQEILEIFQEFQRTANGTGKDLQLSLIEKQSKSKHGIL